MTPASFTMYRVEARPLTKADFKLVRVWNPHEDEWQPFTLKRGKWFTVHERNSDGRFVFSAGAGGATRRLMDHATAEKAERRLEAIGFAVRLVPVEVNRWPNLTGDLDFAQRTGDALHALARELDFTIHVLSGARTLDEQQHLYDLYKAGIGNLAARPNAQAPHIRGIAADAYVNGIPLRTHLQQNRKAHLALKHGITFPVAGEAWHAEVA